MMGHDEEHDVGSVHDDRAVGEPRCAANDNLCAQQHAKAAAPRDVVQQANLVEYYELRESKMALKAKQSAPTMVEGRQVGYDREICITICMRWVRGEDIKVICAKFPMPLPLVFYDWVQNHPEARAIFHCAGAFKTDRMLGKEVGKHLDISLAEWEQEVRARLEGGDALDYVERKIIRIDWNKVYALAGEPPVWPPENRQIYDHLLNVLTRRIEPRNEMELIQIKLVVDALWECRRLACEKNRVPAPSFKSYQALELAQSRAMKRYSTALRQIERSRKGLGGEAQAISCDFLVEPPIPELFADAQTDDGVGEPAAAAPALVPSDEVAQSGRPVVNPVDFEQDVADDRIWEILETTAAGASPNEAADAAPPRAPASEVEIEEGGVTERISWVAWLTGAQRYPWSWLAQAAEKEFKQTFHLKRPLVRKLVLDCKIIRPEQVCAELAKYLPPIAEVAPTCPSPGEEVARAVEAVRPPTPAPTAVIDKNLPTGPVDWVAWLTGAERYKWLVLQQAAQKQFNQSFMSIKSLVRALVVDHKIIQPDRVSTELAQ
jgi:hypothetical protein